MRACIGQHFLIDKNIARKIVNSLNILPSDTIIEIGAGDGVLTAELKKFLSPKKIIAVEIDKILAAKLAKKFYGIKIVNTDFLRWRVPKKRKLKFVANLPYYIATAIIHKILHLNNWELAVFTIQKEVANRIKAQHGTTDYGILSVASQLFCKIEKLVEIPSSCFKPQPEVTSTVIKLTRLKKPLVTKNNEKNFFRVVKSAFLHRRKTILNSLAIELKVGRDILLKKLLQSGISPSARAEMVSINDFIKLTKVLF
ncbi:MAG: 16S rRNA (adenine(1518)-N(6)/adenine(1519)-N(6))-dimethyltransferase RsmA [Elusimicrobiota bacterium]